MSKYKIGIDVGGTKIRLITIYEHEVISVEENPTPDTVEHTYHLLDYMYGHAITLINYAEHTVGVGIPGNIARPTYMFEGTNPQQRLQELFGHEVVVENDANCFALAETKMGAAYGYNNVFGVILGTGVGGGIVLNGELYRGTSGLVAEWGHNVLHSSGRDCWCGLKGCYEAYISGPSIEKSYLESTGKFKQATDILTENDVAPLLIQHDFYKNLATGLANMINILDPEIVVIGGGLSKVKQIYEVVPELVERQLFSKCLTAQIVPAVLTQDAGAIGAALVGK